MSDKNRFFWNRTDSRYYTSASTFDKYKAVVDPLLFGDGVSGTVMQRSDNAVDGWETVAVQKFDTIEQAQQWCQADIERRVATSDAARPQEFYVVELLDNRGVFGARVGETTVGDATMLSCEILSPNNADRSDRGYIFNTQRAIYAMTPCSEDEAREFNKRCNGSGALTFARSGIASRNSTAEATPSEAVALEDGLQLYLVIDDGSGEASFFALARDEEQAKGFARPSLVGDSDEENLSVVTAQTTTCKRTRLMLEFWGKVSQQALKQWSQLTVQNELNSLYVLHDAITDIEERALQERSEVAATRALPAAAAQLTETELIVALKARGFNGFLTLERRREIEQAVWSRCADILERGHDAAAAAAEFRSQAES